MGEKKQTGQAHIDQQNNLISTHSCKTTCKAALKSDMLLCYLHANYSKKKFELKHKGRHNKMFSRTAVFLTRITNN